MIEGWHGVAYDRPLGRTREIIDICRKVWAREERLVHDGADYHLPLPEGQGTGLGKPLLAFSRADIVSKAVARPLRRLTDHSITDPKSLEGELAQIRADGVGYDHEEATPGVSCVAAPVLVKGEPVAEISITVPTSHLQPARLAPAVKTAALGLSRTLSR